jgi:hypothetical protein
VVVAVTAVDEEDQIPGVDPVVVEDLVAKRRRRSDGPANCTKNTKFYSGSDTYCWSCGFDVSKVHDSDTCSYKLQGHQDTATGADTKGGTLKDKEFSKWK